MCKPNDSDTIHYCDREAGYTPLPGVMHIIIMTVSLAGHWHQIELT